MNQPVTSPLGTTGPETLVARHRHWYGHERDANEKMLTMIESVPESARTDPRFGRAVKLAAHLAVCRENFLERFLGRDGNAPWWPDDVSVDTLRPRYALVEAAWSAYLDSLSETTLIQNFVLKEGGGRYLWNIEGQAFQLLGHAAYHRGQVVLLVEELGGTTVDTDYANWAFENDSRFTELTD